MTMATGRTNVAVILAAGVGSRLRPLTNSKPKCLVRVAGKAIIDYQLEALIAAGVRRVVVVAGYESKQLERHLSRIRDVQIDWVINSDFETTNNSYSLYLARETLAGQGFFLVNGDVVLTAPVVHTLAENGAADAVAVDCSTYHWESMKVTTRGSRIIDIAKSIPPERAMGSSIDLYKFSPSGGKTLLDSIANAVEGENRKGEWTEVHMQRLMQAGVLSMEAIDVAGMPWCEVDNLEDLASADTLFSSLSPELPGVRTAIVDLDGTICLGSRALPGAVEALGRMRERGIRVVVCSNNSSNSRQDYVERLERLGFPCSTADVLLSTTAAVEFLRVNKMKRVFVLGTESLAAAVREIDVSVTATDPDIVVVGYDTGLTYDNLARCTQLIAGGVDYVLTHQDLVCPTEAGPVPDAGAIAALLRAATGKEPLAVFGKPDPAVLAPLVSASAFDPRSVIVIGDRLTTDIQLARNMGCRSCLVLTGDTKRGCLEAIATWPDLIVSGLSELLPS